MKVEFKSDGYRDFSQRYLGTYGWYERETSPILVKLTEMDSETLYFKDKYGMKYCTYSDAGNFFTFIPVIKRCYLYLGTPILIKRVPARQYRRGICEDNTIISQLGSGNIFDVDFSTLEAVFTYPLLTGLEQFKKSYTGVAILDGYFAISYDRIFLYETQIGKYDWEKKEITLENSLFSQEVRDSLREAKLDIEVV